MKIGTWRFLVGACGGLVLGTLFSGEMSEAQPAATAPEYVWIEAEHSTDIGTGYYFSTEPDAPLEGRRGWSIAGPGIAPEWTQGGESQWTSIAAHAAENNATVNYPLEVPRAGRYALWVRYADYQNQRESFRLRLNQGGKAAIDHVFGERAVVAEGDEVKLMWGWAFGWEKVEGELAAGPAQLQLVLDAPAQARRQVDCFLLTNNLQYRPVLREKPAFSYWAPLESFRQNPDRVAPALARPADATLPAGWQSRPLMNREFSMFFNMPNYFWEQDKVPADQRVQYPFHIGHGTEILKNFIRDWGGKKDIPIWSSRLVVPVVHFPAMKQMFADDAPFLKWLRDTKTPFGILLNYALVPPNDNFGEQTAMIGRNFQSVRNQFAGYMSGENIGYVYSVENNREKEVLQKLKDYPAGVAGREQYLERVHELYSEGFRQKFARAFGTAPETGNPWPEVMSALSTGMYQHIHKLAEWGERTLAHEATANDPAYALRWAFLRGAARQYGRNWVWYHSSNFGDTATTFVPGGNYAGPHTNYYHSHYDPFSGAGLVWYRKAYFSTYMAGAAGVYLEQGFDQYFIPSPGPDTVRVSPFGRITDEFMKFAERHPDRGTPYTPVAFLLDPGHGWYNYENHAGTFGTPPGYAPQLLGYTRHDAMIRDWFNIAYFPLPRVEGEPLLSPRLNFIASPFGHIYDVLVASRAAGTADILPAYRAVVLAGDVRLNAAWGQALRTWIENGGTLVVTDDQVQGEGAAALQLPAGTANYAQSNEVRWQAGTPRVWPSNTYRYRTEAPQGTTLATAADGNAIAVERTMGQGRLIWIGIPKGLGLDDRATPVMSQIMVHLRDGLLPLQVRGEVEYQVNRNNTGWGITLMNNRGNYKSQHGLGIPRREESAAVTLTLNFTPKAVSEWMTGQTLQATAAEGGSSVQLTIPAGEIRILHLAL